MEQTCMEHCNLLESQECAVLSLASRVLRWSRKHPSRSHTDGVGQRPQCVCQIGLDTVEQLG